MSHPSRTLSAVNRGASMGQATTPVQPRDLLRGLDDDQQACVTCGPGPLAIEAKAGSGKTLVLTRRVAYRAAAGTADPRRTLVVTFTRKAAHELRQRLTALKCVDVDALTMHGLAFKLLHRHWADTGRRPKAILGYPERLVSQALDHREGPLSAPLALREIDWARARALGPERYEPAAQRAGRVNDDVARAVTGVYRRYQNLKRERAVVDTGDLLWELTEAFADRGFAEATRWWYRHILVDEAQDLNAAQWSVLQLLVGDRDDLCLVGDADQAIYGWNGGDSRFLTGMDHAFPVVTRFELARNYRCAPGVVRAASAVLARTPRPCREDDEPGSVRLSAFADDKAEVENLVWQVRQALAEGVGLTQIAVLARTNALLRPVAEALEDSEIPCRMGANLMSEPLVKEALARLDACPPHLPAPGCVTELRVIVNELLDETGGDDSGPRRPVDAGQVRVSGRRLLLLELLGLVEEWADQVPGGQRLYLRDWLASTLHSPGAQGPMSGPAVELATFHRAKGLQWRRVFIIGLEDGVAPLRGGDPDEERRLVYVALTRAEERVSCSWVRRRRSRGDRTLGSPSPLVGIIATACEPSEEATGSLGRDAVTSHLRALQAQLRERLVGPSPTPQGLRPRRSA